jgi:hypothetical protein
VANDGGFAAGLPSPVVKELSWNLDSSGPERLPKTVYLRFLTATFASPKLHRRHHPSSTSARRS